MKTEKLRNDLSVISILSHSARAQKAMNGHFSMPCFETNVNRQGVNQLNDNFLSKLVRMIYVIVSC